MNEYSNNNESCQTRVMGRIKGEKICPRSRRFFQTRECTVWALWLVSVLVGAFAIAVTLFVITYHQYSLYEATHDNALTFIISVLPYLWISIFVGMVGVAVFNLRHTKGGYRYPLWQIFGSSMVLSLAGGAVLHIVGFGYMLDHELGESMSGYTSQEKFEHRLWQDPADGRLLGMQAMQAPVSSSTVVFTDVQGVSWDIDITELTEAERELLGEGETVKVIGMMNDSVSAKFYSCGVFPFIEMKDVTRKDLASARDDFLRRMKWHKERAEMVALGATSSTPCTAMKSVR